MIAHNKTIATISPKSSRTPIPIDRTIHEPGPHRIHMNVVDFLIELNFRVNIPIIPAAALPKSNLPLWACELADPLRI